MKTRWSAIIPTRNRVDTLMGTLACLTAQTLPPTVFEVLVVDNGSTDATPERVQAFMAAHPPHRIRYIREETPGLLAGRHRGTQEAEADILTFFDDDVELGPDFALHVLKTFADDEVALAGGPCRPKFEDEPPAWLERYWVRDKAHSECGCLSLMDYGDEARDIDPGKVWGLNYSIRKQTLCDLGGFHPDGMPDDLLMFRGDGESGLSAKAKNQELLARYVPELLVTHRIPAHRVSEEGLKKRFFAQGISDSYTEIRRYGLPCGRICPLPMEESGNGEQGLHARIHNAYVDGYYFHQCAVRKSAKLLEWVLRQNYWDYTCPELEDGVPFSRAYASNLLTSPMETLLEPDKVCRLAAAYLEKGRSIDALRAIGQVERMYPLLTEVRALKAAALLTLDRLQEAQEYAQAELAVNPYSDLAVEVWAKAQCRLAPTPLPGAKAADSTSLERLKQQENAFHNAKPEELDSRYRLSNNTRDNVPLMRQLRDQLVDLGVSVADRQIDIDDFEKWCGKTQSLVQYYQNADYQIEKCLEHYLSYRFLRLDQACIYMDVAAHGSPFVDILEKQAGMLTYRLDMAYPRGVSNRRIGCDAGNMCLPGTCIDAMSLQCAYECFMGDADRRFLSEAARVLRPGGKCLILPLYMYSTPLNRLSHACDLEGVTFDADFLRLWRTDGMCAPFSRTYSPPAFVERCYGHLPENLASEVIYFTNLDELARKYPGQRIYCHFAWFLEKTDGRPTTSNSEDVQHGTCTARSDVPSSPSHRPALSEKELIRELCMKCPKFDSVVTHLTLPEKVTLFSLAKQAAGKRTVVVEIGSYVGASSLCIAAGLDTQDTLYCVDTWKNEAMSEGCRDTYAEFIENTQDFSNIVPLRGKSGAVALTFEKEIDFLFFDGDHSYAGVSTDVKLWWPKIKKGAIVAFHDISWAEGVNKVLKESVFSNTENHNFLPNLFFAVKR